MTTHSVCQPGRPGPHGEAHQGSAGFAFFHRAKSKGERFFSFTSTRAPRAQRGQALVGEQPVVVDGRDREIDAVARLISGAEHDELGDELHHLLDEGGRVRNLRRQQASQGVHRLPPFGLVLLRRSPPAGVAPRSLAR